jgi:hypothetical protein
VSVALWHGHSDAEREKTGSACFTSWKSQSAGGVWRLVCEKPPTCHTNFFHSRNLLNSFYFPVVYFRIIHSSRFTVSNQLLMLLYSLLRTSITNTTCGRFPWKAPTFENERIIRIGRIWDSHSHGYGGVISSIQHVESHTTFRRNISLPSIESKSKSMKKRKEIWSWWIWECIVGMIWGFHCSGYRALLFLRNAVQSIEDQIRSICYPL